MKKNKGFTLVELLAVIVILSLVVGITIYVYINAVNKSKENSYKVTINNIEKEASNYLTENKNRLFFITDTDNPNIEYQCLTIQNLIDYGYFQDDILESKVSKNKQVSKDDYIYIERDKKTLTINKTKYLLDDEKLMNTCNVAIAAEGDISFSASPSLDTWSKSKEITINYKIKNLNDLNTFNDYSYGYSFNDIDSETNKENTKKFKIDNNGKISASIYNKDGKAIKTVNLLISTIDNDKPSIKINPGSDSKYTKSKNVRVVLNDNGSGIKRGAVVKYGWSASLDVEPSYSEAFANYNDGDNIVNIDISTNNLNGSYYLWVKYDINDLLNNNLNGVIKSTGVFNFDNKGPIGTVNLSVGDDTINASVINVSDVNGIKSYEYYISNNNSCPTSGYASGSSSYIFRNITNEGTYYVCVKLTDDINNSSVIKNSIYVERKQIDYISLSKSYKCANISSGSSPYLLTYTGNCSLSNDGGNNFLMQFLTSGTVNLTSSASIDIFLVGGGGGGGMGSTFFYTGGGGGGGGSGYTATYKKIKLSSGISYSVSIGAGGAGDTTGGFMSYGANGGNTSAFGYTANGGRGGGSSGLGGSGSGGNGGSGGGNGAYIKDDVSEYTSSGNGGTNGSNGGTVYGGGGNGQGTTTRAFGESSGTLYSGGGGGGAAISRTDTVGLGVLAYYGTRNSGTYAPGGSGGGARGGGHLSRGESASSNTGGGGGGGGVNNAGGNGGSGIVIIRNAR